MTIAIGMKHSEGYLLCADTLVAIPGYYKEARSKLRTLFTKSCRAYFAFAGNVEFTNRALEVIKLYLDRSDPDILHVKSALDTACFEVYDKWQGYVEEPLQLIGVIAVKDQLPEFIMVNGGLVSPAGNLACLGTGEPLARFLFSGIKTADLSRSSAVRYAAYVLFNVKNRVEGCGGLSEFLDVNEQGGWHFPLLSNWVFELLPEMESSFASLDRQLRRIAAAFIGDSAGSLELTAHESAEQIVKIRRDYLDKVEARELAYIQQRWVESREREDEGSASTQSDSQTSEDRQ